MKTMQAAITQPMLPKVVRIIPAAVNIQEEIKTLTVRLV